MTLQLRPANERGHADHGWLRTWHTFSFADYQDPAHMGFRALRVLNDDRIRRGTGFGMHGHRDMEILTWVLEGELEHRDSLGNGGRLRPGDAQRMTAGTGIVHSEQAGASADVHLLQIWLLPERRGLQPSYEERHFEGQDLARLRLVASPDGRDGSLTLHLDATVEAVRLAPGVRVERPLAPGRHAWIQIARGEATLNGTRLAAGDGAAASGLDRLVLEGGDAEALLFDLA